MLYNGNYSPTQLLNFCKINAFDWRNPAENLTATILALVVIEKDPIVLREKITKAIQDYSKISIGHSLEKLDSIANVPNEFEGNLDGVDALAYHLSGNLCTKGIAALQKVLRRFEQYELNNCTK